ncbi:MAG: hypothetical protein F6K28_01855 [Microcoleus sp. SIO2G3]|nr:hypothetical protein [Microcoleus sp. SIO2G3]
MVTGFPAGWVSPVGHATSIPVVIDRRAAELQTVYGGGGTEDVLLRIRPRDIIRLTNATIADITSILEDTGTRRRPDAEREMRLKPRVRSGSSMGLKPRLNRRFRRLKLGKNNPRSISVPASPRLPLSLVSPEIFDEERFC